MHALAAIALVTLATTTAAAVAAEIGPSDDIETAVAALTPGDELVLRGGTYVFDENITLSANGTETELIVIRAKSGEQPILTQATNQQNVVEVRNSSYLVLRGIEFTGGSHGIRLINSDFITIEDCEIYETGDVAISANAGGTYEGLRILRNHIRHTNGTGEGMYLGCNRDRCRVANSVIEGNYVHHTNRATVSQGDGIEIKEGSYGNVVRDNVIHDTNYPGILVYGTASNGAANVIERNVIWNVKDNTVQIAADTVFRNNIVLGNVAIQAHQSSRPSNIQIVHNTIITSGNAVSVRNVAGPILVANNAIYSQGTALRLISGDLAQVDVARNIGAGGATGTGAGYMDGNGIASDMINAGYHGAPPLDAFPAPGSALIGAGLAQHVVAEDFNGTPRSGAADVGAYTFDAAGNPGWQITAGLKQPMGVTPPNPRDDIQAD